MGEEQEEENNKAHLGVFLSPALHPICLMEMDSTTIHPVTQAGSQRLTVTSASSLPSHPNPVGRSVLSVLAQTIFQTNLFIPVIMAGFKFPDALPNSFVTA